MKRVNILPGDLALEYRYKDRWKYLIKTHLLRFIATILILEIFLFGSFHAIKGLILYKMKSDFRRIKEEVSLLLVKLETQEEEIARISEEIKDTDEGIADAEKRLNFLNSIKRMPKDYSNILSEVNIQSPPKIWITYLSVKGEKLKIVGGSYDTLLVTRFMSNLQQSPYFKNADFAYTKKGEIEDIEVIEFEFTCIVKKGRL